MAIVKCKVCRNDVEETLPKCPHCDSMGPKKSRKISMIMIVLLVVLGIGVVFMIYNRTQEKVRTREEITTARTSERIHQRVMSASFLLRTSVADPDSVVIDRIRTNVDGSVLCYEYRLNKQQGLIKAVFAEGHFNHSKGSWEIYCSDKQVTDLPDKPPPID